MCAVLPPAAVGNVTVEESSGASGNIPDHEAYTSRYQEVTEIDRVQCEIEVPTSHLEPANVSTWACSPTIYE